MTWIVTMALVASSSLPENITENCLYLNQAPISKVGSLEQPVRFALQADRLKPQVESLLKEHWDIQEVIWYADPHHVWPTEFELLATDWNQLLSKILEPYQLRVSIHENHTAVVDYLPSSVSS